MFYETKTITLKDGRTAILRSPNENDAQEMVDFMKQIYTETDFLMRYPEEVTITMQQERNWIQNSLSSNYALMLLCELDGEIVGTSEINFNRNFKTKHRASLGISIKKKCWSLGIGTKMFEQLEDIAKKQGVLQLELEYIEGNERGLALYKKMGFEEVSYKPDAIRLKDGTFLKEIFMRKKIGTM